MTEPTPTTSAPALGITPNGGEPFSAARRVHHPSTHDVQVIAEGVPVAEVVGGGQRLDFMGESFRIAARTGIMPLLKFSASADRGLDSRDYKGLAALHAMVKDCIDGEMEWTRFEAHAIAQKAEADDLFDFVNRVVELLTARPTGQPGRSSAGQPATSDGSKGSPSSPDIAELAELITVDSLVDR